MNSDGIGPKEDYLSLGLLLLVTYYPVAHFCRPHALLHVYQEAYRVAIR